LRFKNIGHRDIKPENIICFKENKENSRYIFKLGDFGAGI